MSFYKKISNQPAIGIAQPRLINRRIDADYYMPIFIKNEERMFNSGIDLKKLGDMWIEANYGSLPDSADYAKGGISLIRGTDLTGFAITSEENLVKVPEDYYDKFRKARVQEGELLLLVKGASIDRPDSTAILPKLQCKAIINGSVFRIKLKDEYNKYFVAAFMFSNLFLQQKRRAVTNTGALYNDFDTIKEYLIPDPAPEIQTYIGSKVRLAEKCREEAEGTKERAIRVLDDKLNLPPIQEHDLSHWLPDAVFVDPVRLDPRYYNPKFTKAISSLIDKGAIAFGSGLLTDVRYGASVPADYSSSGIPFIRGVDLLPNRFDFSALQYLPESYRKAIGRARVKTGDVLITRSGSVGTAAVIPAKADGYAFGSFMIRLRFIDKLNPYYVAAFLNSPTRSQPD